LFDYLRVTDILVKLRMEELDSYPESSDLNSIASMTCNTVGSNLDNNGVRVRSSMNIATRKYREL